MDTGTIVSLISLGVTIVGSVVYLANRDGKQEAKVDGLEKELGALQNMIREHSEKRGHQGSLDELANIRERLSLSEQHNETIRSTLNELHETLREFRADMKATLKEFRDEVKLLVDERIRHT